MEFLNVFVRDVLVGKLFEVSDKLSFSYDEKYSHSVGALPISLSLPLSGIFESDAVEAFFSGLLPDENLKKKLARYFKISENNTFALLKEVGAECAGAISVLPADKIPYEPNVPEYNELSEEQSYTLLSELQKIPLGVDFDGYFRVSGSGAQDKLMAMVKDGKVSLPINGTPSIHIIKPEIQSYPNSQFDEYFCMTLAGRLGLNVPKVSLLHLRDKTFFVTERYDRVTAKNGYIIRLHQEDFCQAMHINPKIKYENEGGPSIKSCYNCLKNNSFLAGRDCVRFLETLMFNFLIGNGDAHGKNFSLLYDKEKITFAPLYDLMSSMALREFNRKEKMAMKIDGEYLFEHIFMRKFTKLALELGLKEDIFSQILQNRFNNMLEVSANLRDELQKDKLTASLVYDKICEVIEKNYQQLV